MTIANKIFFSTVIFIQLYLLSLFISISTIQELILVLSCTVFAFYRPLWALSLFFLALPLFTTGHMQTDTNYTIIGFTSAVLLGLYANLLLKLPMRFKRFLIKTRFTSIIIILIFFYVISLLFGTIGQPMYSLYHNIFIINNSEILINFYYITPQSDLYPLKSTLMIIESILIGLYIFGIIKYSNQIRILHHILLALFFGLILSFIIVTLSYLNIYKIDFLYIQSSLYSQYLILTLPLLPIVLLLHKLNRFYILLVVLLMLFGGVCLTLSMQLNALITYPFIMFAIWTMIFFIIMRIKYRQKILSSFLKSNWRIIIFTFLLTIFTTIFIAFIVEYIHGKNLYTSKAINSYQEKQNQRAEAWSLSTKLFMLNPIYGTGFGSFQWKANKLQKNVNAFKKLNNLYLETLIGSGLIGLMFFASFIALIFYKLAKKEFSKQTISLEISILGLMVLTSLFSISVYANITNIFESFSIMIIFWIVVFMGVSFTHSYIVTQIQKSRAKKFLSFMSYIVLYLLIIHILNFTIIKKFFSLLLSETFPIFNENNSLELITYLLGILIIEIIASILVYLKIIFYSNEDNLFIGNYGNAEAHAIHKTDIPRVGGIGIYLANIFLVFNPIGWKIILISLPSFLIGFADDIKSVTPKIRLLFQAISAILSVIILHTLVYSIGFGILLPTWLSLFISIFAIIGVTNAINIIDGLNGLASGISLMIFISIGFISFTLDDMVLFEVIAINIIALIGFLLLNFPKGKIFLGDGGAYFIGFSLASISLILVYTHKEVSIFYPLLLLIYPIWEVIFTIYRRKVIKKAKATQADNMHLHGLIYERITRNNPKATLYIWKRVLPFIVLATIFYNNDIILLIIIFIFIIFYNLLYRKIINRIMVTK